MLKVPSKESLNEIDELRTQILKVILEILLQVAAVDPLILFAVQDSNTGQAILDAA